MKKAIFLVTLLISILIFRVNDSLGQEFMPFTQSNYAGVSGLAIQPASIADSRYNFDMVLFGGDFSASNNFLAIRREAIFRPSLWEEEQFGNDYIYQHYNGEDKTGLIKAVMFMPSFMVNLSDYSALAVSMRIRGVSNFDNVTEDFARLLAENFDYAPLINRTLTNENLSIQASIWSEFGVTYANVIPLKSEKHFLKGGLTLKYLQGIAAGYVFVNNLSFRLDGQDTLSLFQSDFNYGLSGNLDSEDFDPFDYISDPGIGMDLGFVYEYRPNIENHKYNMDGRKGLLRPDQDKYLLRIGVSLLDLGRVKYTKGFNSQDFKADVRNWDLTQVEIESVKDLNDTLINRFGLSAGVHETFLMRMPTALSIQADYNIGKGFYVNFSPYLALRRSTDIVSKTHNYTSFSLTPRYDHKWFGAALPMQADEFGRFRAGMALRLGPVWIGSNSIITNNLASKTFNADAYVMLKIPIFRHVERDRDKDEISDKLDMCPDVPGIWEQKGCPDSDGDGITDDKDECPSEKGLVELNGCPDRDGDGIADKNDKCPDYAGPEALGGCPDADGDGIIDPLDECPDQPGTEKMKGCPDRDGDGIKDSDDKCPDQAGKPEYGGCPFADYDKDGIADELDKCPATAGPAEFDGCPDTDGDGIHDGIDLCPYTAGVKENNGCPEIKKEEKAIIDKAFSNLEFETGKAVIKAVSYASLNELAQLLKTKEGWKVLLSGHTDNTGTPAGNMELSKNRAQAVKDYLIGQGVPEFKIKAEWFGQEMPIADNKTSAGRQKNRRVEMKIVFE
mgnify:CR=1 FL=1